MFLVTLNESELKVEQNVRREDKDRLSFAPLTNRFATLTKEWRRRPLDKIGEEKVLFGSLFGSAKNRENEENDACTAVNQLWMQTLGKTVKEAAVKSLRMR